MQLAEPLLTVVGYNASSELGRVSAMISRETDAMTLAVAQLK